MNTQYADTAASVELEQMLDHLDRTSVRFENFGCFVALSQDKSSIFACPMNADGSPDRDSDNSRHMNWSQVTAPDLEFLDKVNEVFDTTFELEHFAGR